MPNVSAELVFIPAERRAQARWGDPAVWDGARIERLIWNHIPERYRARVEALGRNTDLAIAADGNYQFCFNDIRHSRTIGDVRTLGVREALAIREREGEGPALCGGCGIRERYGARELAAVAWHCLRARHGAVKPALS